MLYGAKLHPFRIAGYIPHKDLPGVFYYFRAANLDDDKPEEHWLFVEAVDEREADKIVVELGYFAFFDNSEYALQLAGIARTVEMQRIAAGTNRLNIWDDGFKDNYVKQ